MDRSRTHSPRRLLALVVGVTVVPLGAFLWLGWKMAAQDRAIDTQQRRERLELAAERVVAAVERALSASEQSLTSGQRQWADGAVAVVSSPERVDVSPAGRLAYLPVAAPLRDVPHAPFSAAESLEFRAQDRRGAIVEYGRLSGSSDRAVRAGALLRLARNLALAGQTDAALKTYAALAEFADIAETSVPVSLAAAWGRCSILAELRRDEELRREAGRLLARLRAGEWPVGEAVYMTYAADAARWSSGDSSPSASEVLAAAVARLWAEGARRGSQGSPRRQSVTIDDTTVVAVAGQGSSPQRLLVALPAFVESEWLSVARAAAREHDVDVTASAATALTDTGGSRGRADAPVVTIAAIQSDLPWTLTFRASSASSSDGKVTRGHLLLSGFSLLAALWLTASALILRSVRREMAVARLQSDFVAAVSHEFRTPLTTLRQFTERLRAHPHLDADARLQCYDAQGRATDRLTKLVESVLDFGRMEAGARPYTLAEHDCTVLVERAVAEFRDTPQAASHPITLSPNGAMPACVDDEAMSRAVANLLENAAKYSPEGAEITVMLSSAGGEGRIAVTDRGLGIPAAERKRLFLKFQRGEQARRLGIKGTGIGLAMVDHIVRAHAGRVEVESEPGCGSTFTIVLPLKG